MVTGKLLAVNLMVNDPNTGEPVNRVSSLQLDQPLMISLDGHGRELPVEFEINPAGHWLNVNDRFYRFQSHEVWKGNWCWDQVMLSPEDVADLVNQLLLAGWNVDEADSKIYGRMTAEKHIRAEDLAA